MFKKILIIISVLFFALTVLSLSVMRASGNTFAQNSPLKFAVNPNPEALSTPSPEIKYYLPYPGILPDHPLYALKMIRDRIWLWLTTNSYKKAQVLLLFADKRLGAAKVLIEGNKIALGVTTLEKAEKYLEQVAGQLEEAQKKGLDIEPQRQKLETAARKHEEVILELQTNLGEEAGSVLEKILDYPRGILARVQNSSEE